MDKAFFYFPAVLIFVILRLSTCNADLEKLKSSVTTSSLIARYGYPGEEHKVTTEDGYILTTHRIPYSPKNISNSTSIKRPVIFIMHGFMQSSCDFVLSGYPRGLAFLLSDAGYDVWLGNARGTRFSQDHKNMVFLGSKYWDFSWHEIGIYDLPANIDYILKNTASTQLQYIGHSQGTTAFLVATSSLPKFNDKINSAFLLAPVAYVSDATSPFIVIGAALSGQPRPLVFGETEWLPNTRLGQKLSKALCGNNSVIPNACMVASSLFFGFGSSFTNTSALEILFETIPAGTSTKQLFHFLQLFNSEEFRQFDYGLIDNKFVYHQTSPPNYKLENIRTPIHLYHSENDALADPKDVQKLIDSLQPSTLKKAYKMPFESWNHIDFILANDVDKHLYSILLKDIMEAREMV